MRAASACLVLALSASLVAQIRAPATGAAGSAIDVDVGAGVAHVCYGVEGSRDVRWLLVGPSGRVTIELPPAPPGSVVRIWVGRGARRRSCRVVIQ